jgi:ABC-type multidrug transport system fused ATPase/permease subunit
MEKNWKILITSKDRKNIGILFFVLLLSTFVEMVGISSIPIFAIIITDSSQLRDYLPSYINLDFFLDFEKKKLIFFTSFSLLLIFIFKNLILTFINYFQAYTIKHLKINIYQKLFKLYINSNYEFHISQNPSFLIRNITSEVGRAANYILNVLNLIKEFLIMITIFFLLLFVDFKISLLTFSLLSLFSLIFYFLSKKGAKERGEIVQVVWASILKAVNQGIGSVKETKILNKEKYITTLFDKNVNTLEKYNLHQSFMISLPRIFLEIIAILTIVTVTILFFIFERDESTFVPLISLITVASLRLIPSFNTITSSIARIKYLHPAFRLISQQIQETSINIKINKNSSNKIISNLSLNFKNKLELKDIDYFYPNSKKKIIDNLSLEISFGEIVGIIGQSGAGKSTLIDIITGLLIPSKGKIIIDGNEVNFNEINWQNQIGYVPQEVYLFDDTIKANIAFGIDKNEINYEHLDQAIKLAELDKFINDLPEKENTQVGDRGIRLSGGQKQRIGIARSLYFRPKILIFDEPTSSLDQENENKIMRHIFSLVGDLTIIIISHKLTSLNKCRKIINIENGKIKEISDYDTLIKSQ